MVSIIIPTHDRVELLALCLESIRAQTASDWECIIVDDHSSDDTLSLLAEFPKKDSRFVFHRLEGARRGANAARNFGFENAKGDLILFIDSDDALHPACLAGREEKMRENPSLDFGIFLTLLFRKRPGDCDLLWNVETAENDLHRFLSLDIPWQTAGVLWRREALCRLGPWLEHLPSWQDWEFHLRALLRGFRYQRFAGVDSYWRMARYDSLWNRSHDEEHLRAHLGLMRNLVEEMRRDGELDQERKAMWGGLYFWQARKWYSKLRRRRVAIQVWTEAWKLGLVPFVQFIEGLRWFSRTTRGPHDDVEKVFPRWPTEFRTGNSKTFMKVPHGSPRASPGKKIRIGIFVDEWRDGGVPVFLQRLEGFLTAQGHEVFLFLAHPYPKRDTVSKQLYLQLKQQLGDRCISLDYRSLPSAWRHTHFREVILSRKISCLLINHFSQYVDILASLAERLSLISVAHTDLDYYYTEYLRTMNFTRAHVVVSERIREKTQLLTAPEYAHRIHYIPYGIDESTDLFRTELKGPFRVVYCARLDFIQKRCQDLIPIWKSFLQQGGTGELIILGVGRGEQLLQSAFTDELKSGQVRMYRQVSSRRVLEEMACSDVLLNLSNYEGLPQVVLEGASLGLHPLLSDIESGHREIIHRLGCGTLCHVGDVAAFTRELSRLRSDLTALRSGRKAIRESTLRHYLLHNSCSRYLEVLQRTACEPRPLPSEKPSRRRLKDRLQHVFLKAKYRRHFHV
jgi:glycosyltransferase involved in cell wall biosynthesis